MRVKDEIEIYDKLNTKDLMKVEQKVQRTFMLLEKAIYMMRKIVNIEPRHMFEEHEIAQGDLLQQSVGRWLAEALYNVRRVLKYEHVTYKKSESYDMMEKTLFC